MCHRANGPIALARPAVHKTTALTTSLLALIVFPFEQIEYGASAKRNPETVKEFKELKLADLVSGEARHEWKFENVAVPLQKPYYLKNGYDLVRCLRNAI